MLVSEFDLFGIFQDTEFQLNDFSKTVPGIRKFYSS